MFRNFIIQLLATFFGVIFAFSLSYWYDNYKNKKLIISQIIFLLSEIKTNNVTIKQLRGGLEGGFTLDRLQDDSVDTLMRNPKLFSIHKKNLDFIRKIIIYKKVVCIGNRMIDSCYENYKDGLWAIYPENKKNQVKILNEKLDKVIYVANQIDGLAFIIKLKKVKI